MAETHKTQPDSVTEVIEAIQGPPAEDQAPQAQQPDLEALQAQIEGLRAKSDAHWDQLLRLQAEMENQRKRSARDVEQAHKYALEKFITELLPVKDSLELGVASTTQDTDITKLKEGLELTLKMLERVLEKFDIAEIDPHHQPFDPTLHQAMTLKESEALAPNTVASVMQKGYLLNDRLIRPALVIVSKAPPGDSNAQGDLNS